MNEWLLKATAHLPMRQIRSQGQSRYLERHLVYKSKWLTIYVHRYVGTDNAAEELHDHPWSWACGFVLKGGYTEERMKWLNLNGPEYKLRHVRWFWPNLIRTGDAHRIIAVRENTWTLFLHGRRVKDWGFYNYVDTSEGDAVFYHNPWQDGADKKDHYDWKKARLAVEHRYMGGPEYNYQFAPHRDRKTQ